MVALIFLFIIVFIIIIIFAASYSHAAKESNDLSNYKNTILTEDNAGLQLQIDKKTEELKNANEQITTLKSKIEELESQNASWVSHIETLQKEAENKNILLQNLEETIEELQNDNERLDATNEKLTTHIKEQNKYLTTSEQLNISNFFAEADRQEKIKALNKLIYDKKENIKKLESQIIELNDKILLQNFGLYEPIYNFATSEQYKDKLAEIRTKQKQMIKEGQAAVCSTQWTVDGNRTLGLKMTRDKIKETLLAFNVECENVISKVKFNNYDSMQKRIDSMYNKLNRLNEVNQITISQEFYNLKLEELALAFEYSEQKQKEKEYAREQREIARENARVQRELEEERAKFEKEQIHYKNQLQKLNEQLEMEKSIARQEVIQDKISAVNDELDNIQKALDEVNYRQANERAGYVYIISNIGSFGEDIYKIGMTRRLAPQDRIDELSGAAVPFRFDVHAFIFSADAPRLESKLHNRFAHCRVNMVNGRKEFYHVKLEEIENAVHELTNEFESAEFIQIAQAQQFRESIRIRQSAKNNTSYEYSQTEEL